MLETSRKIVVVGDGMVGKTALLQAYVLDKFQADYIPTVFETAAKTVELSDGRTITLGLWDTGGQEEFDQIRQLAYPGASLVLMCYSVDSPTSLDNILHTWLTEVRAYCPSVPLILVGCKSDRRSMHSNIFTSEIKRNQTEEGFVLPDRAEAVRKRIGALVHLECSAFTRANVETVFQLAARFILDHPTSKTRGINLGRILSLSRESRTANGTVPMNQSHEYPKRAKKSRLSCFSGRT